MLLCGPLFVHLARQLLDELLHFIGQLDVGGVDGVGDEGSLVHGLFQQSSQRPDHLALDHGAVFIGFDDFADIMDEVEAVGFGVGIERLVLADAV